MNGLELKDICFSYHEGVENVDFNLNKINLKIKKEEFISFMGPSGCGKTTLLKLMSGLLYPSRGDVFIDSLKINGVSDNVGFVFQDYSLFPWLNVLKNVEFGLNLSNSNTKKDKNYAVEILEQVGLKSQMKKYPHELSGGMKQRVAVARSLANHNDYLLMDEPFGALDYQTRFNMQELLLKVWGEFKKTIVFITHQVDEAILLSDRIYLMSKSKNNYLKELKIDISRPRDISSIQFNKIRTEIINHFQNELP